MRYWHALVLALSMTLLLGCPSIPDPQPEKILKQQIGSGPRGLAITADGEKLYVALSQDNAVAVVRASDLTVLKTIPVGQTPRGVALRPDEAFLYVTNRDSQNVSVISTADDTVVSTIATGGEQARVIFSQDGTRAYTALNANGSIDSGKVYVLDAINHSLLTVLRPANIVWGLALSPDGRTLYLSDMSRNLFVIDTADYSTQAVIPVNDSPDELHLSPDGQSLYVMHRMTNHVLTLRTADRAIVGDSAAGGPYGLGTPLIIGAQGGMGLSPDGSRLYVTDHPQHGIAVIDTTDYAVLNVVPVDGETREMVVDPVRGYIYVSVLDKNELVAIRDTAP